MAQLKTVDKDERKTPGKTLKLKRTKPTHM